MPHDTTSSRAHQSFRLELHERSFVLPITGFPDVDGKELTSELRRVLEPMGPSDVATYLERLATRLGRAGREMRTSPEKVTHVEIHAGLLKCECGEERFLADSCRGGTLLGDLVAHPEQTCSRCGAVWWIPATADCDRVEA